MHARSHIILGGIFLWLAAEITVANQIRLLDGRLSLATPVDVSPRRLAPTQSPRFSVLTDLTSSDGSFSVLVTYGKGSLETRNLADFLRDKISSYNSLNGKAQHFHWIDHRVVERNGRQWAQICFSYDNESGAHVYTRCLSCFVEGHLLEIWALTRRATDFAQKSYVDQLIGSVRLTS
jgi:hypothetical protein